MESSEERQQQEITALQAIYAEDFIECPPPKAWKGAMRLPEFNIKISHPDPQHAANVFVHLNTKFPKTYPEKTCPTFTVQQPMKGLPYDRVSKLTHAMQAEAQRKKGSEMVLEIVDFIQEWLSANIKPAPEMQGSFAAEMIKRASDEERAKRERADAEAREEAERAAARAAQVAAEIDAERQHAERERATVRAQRQRANTDATEVPEWLVRAGDTPVEVFGKEIELSGVSFTAVKMFHPRKEWLGTTYLVEPVSDDVNATLPLELHVVEFTSPYYASHQGRKKLHQLDSDLQRLVGIRNENLLCIHAIKMTIPKSGHASRLAILYDQRPPSNLADVLADCDFFREDRATEYIKHIIFGLQAIHHVDIVHRALCIETIGLASRNDALRTKQVKIGKVGWFGRLLALHRSDPIGLTAIFPEPTIPEAWQPKEAIESPLNYTRARDIHCAGVVLMQMLLGRDVMERWPDPQSALNHSSLSAFMQHLATRMLSASRRHPVTCQDLLADLAEQNFRRYTHSPSIATSGPKTPIPSFHSGSPPDSYFQAPISRRVAHSRYKEDWEELERLGSGGFGSVFKARNKVDKRVYAVKKIKLRAVQSKKDDKIFREVNTLSRLNHRFIVRYFTTWIESTEPESAAPSDSETEEEGDSADVTADGLTSTPDWGVRHLALGNGDIDDSLDLNPFAKAKNGVAAPGLVSRSVSVSSSGVDDFGSGGHGSFPSIHFSQDNDDASGSSEDEGDQGVIFGFDEDEALSVQVTPASENGFSMSPAMQALTPSRALARTLYIQMEFVENQTLRERIADGISVSDAWKLFHQIVDALVHMSNLGIIHRDIKLTNIFIDAKGDVKVGDFGLATSSLAAVDPSDLPGLQASNSDTDMTQNVGTFLYIAPEIRSRGGPRNHSKADMYSLGIVFFEMNHIFSTASERMAVIEDLRTPNILFPSDWDTARESQQKIIRWLLQHDPAQRPTAIELSQSSLMPPRMEDEYFRGALQMMVKPESQYFPTVLSSLFSQPINTKISKPILYDHATDSPEHTVLNGVVQQTLADIFHLHGAVDMEPLLLMPRMNVDEGERPVLLDRHGDLVTLPDHGLLPFARLAARRDVTRIKRYHIGNVYKSDLTTGHPRVSKTAVFDIITPDLTHGPAAAAAEIIAVTHECLSAFPTLNGQNCEIRVSHAKIVDIALSRIPSALRKDIIEIIMETKSTSPQRRARMLKKGLLRSIADELEFLNEIEEDWELFPSKLEKVSPLLSTIFAPFFAEIKEAVQYAITLGVTYPITLHPLMIGKYEHFKDGLCFDIVRRKRRSDVIASGGRYDSLIGSFAPARGPGEPSVCAIGVQIELDRVTAALAAYQSTSVKALLKEQRSFGFWTPRRCDVYVVSYLPGHLQDRLEVAALLWQNGISADIMYESGLPDSEQENHLETCFREGILFTVYPRYRAARRDQPAFKVKSVLKGSEYEVSRQELVGWLHEHIAEQKRVDATTSGVSAAFEPVTNGNTPRDPAATPDVHLLLPSDAKKQRKHTKQLFRDRLYDMTQEVKTAAANGLQTIGVDVPPVVFEALTRNSAWISDDDSWRPIASIFPTGQSAYATQVRETVARRKADGNKFLLFYAVREDRVGILTL